MTVRRLATGLLLVLAAGAMPGSAPLVVPSPPHEPVATWSFEPAPDAFSPDALLDLRSLNEHRAGETGFVRVGTHGEFVRGDGQPLRFWAVNTDVGRAPFVARPLRAATAPDLARHARFLAKRGVNMVRLHRQLGPDLAAHPDAAITDINEVERDGIWRTVAAMRAEGIYTTISPYSASSMKLSKAWGLAGGAEQSALGLLFFDATLQAAYRAWLKKLLTPPNPYTGVSLAKDPSVAIIQLQNEDSLLFWTVAGIKGAQREALESAYARFLVGKYGSLANAAGAWPGEHIATDIARVALLEPWELTGAPGKGGHAARLADQTEFYATTMRDFNRATVEYLRNEIGAEQLVNAGNWKTASNERLGDAERWSYTPGEVDAANVYTGGVHQGPNSGWAIGNGDRFTSESVLRNPLALPINLKQTAGRPMLVTEGAWVMPNGLGAEGPFLISAYASLTGIAGYYWFSTDEEGWAPPQSANGYQPSQTKWEFADPDMLGTFPAAALAYRRGGLRRATPAVSEQRTPTDLWQRRAPLLFEDTSFDPNRDTAGRLSSPGSATRVPPAAFLVGPVELTFDAASASSHAGPFDGLIAPGVIRSSTGQIAMHWAKGFCTIDAPTVQGVAAHFADAPVHELSDVSLKSGNAFGAVMVVAMDGAPLARAQRILVQYGTQSRPTGWTQKPVRITSPGQPSISGMEITSYGRAPWQVESAQLDVTIRNPGLTSATVLDMNGMAVGTVPLTRSAKQVEFRFPASAMYVVLR